MNDASAIEVAFSVNLNLTDLPELRLRGASLGLFSTEDGLSAEEALYYAAVCPDEAPLNTGFELLQGSRVTPTKSAGQYLLSVIARVYDEESVTRAAIEAYQSAWADITWEPTGLAEALYELLLASNKNPSPSDLGFEIVSWNAPMQELCPALVPMDEMVA